MPIQRIAFVLLMIACLVGWSRSGEAARADCGVQMMVMDSDGTVVTSSTEYQLKFYSNPTPVAGEAEIADSVTGTATPDNGLLEVSFPCSSAGFRDAGAAYLEISLGSDSTLETLTPRTELMSVLYANFAANLVSPAGGVAGQIYMLDDTGVGSWVTLGGDITVTGAGVTTVSPLESLTATTGTVTTLNSTTGTVTTLNSTTGTVTTLNSTTATVGTLSVTGNASTTGNLTVTGTITSGCPTGFSSAGNYCIETAERADATWFVAAETCQGQNAQLCSGAQWHAACAVAATLNPVLNNMLDDQEWVDEHSGINQAMAFNGGIGDCSTLTADAQGNAKAYRCCYSK